jgi:hypothetical protein
MDSSYAAILTKPNWLCQGYNRHSFGRFGVFQGVTTNPNKKNFPNRPSGLRLCAPRSDPTRLSAGRSFRQFWKTLAQRRYFGNVEILFVLEASFPSKRRPPRRPGKQLACRSDEYRYGQ